MTTCITRRTLLALVAAASGAVPAVAIAAADEDRVWEDVLKEREWRTNPVDAAAVRAALLDARAQGVRPEWITGTYVSFVRPEAGVTFTTPDGTNYQTKVRLPTLVSSRQRGAAVRVTDGGQHDATR